MAKNMTFSVSLSLLTKNFNKGIKAVQSSLQKLRGTFNTILGGIGVGLSFNEILDTAKQLDKVQTTLRNVSGSYEKFGENMKFVNDLSKKYNQDLITLTGNYAKFYSAASYAGFALEEQQHIYEALTRASAYFNLTADETNGVMLAVQQMISKGRVSSEELRRQLGERLPGAMNLAAKAMGMTTAELDKAIRDGNVLASELLPLLASELNTLTQNLDVNTIQGLIAKLKNSFTELVDNLNIDKHYKKALSWMSEKTQWFADDVSRIFSTLGTALGGIFGGKVISNTVDSFNTFTKKLEDGITASQTKLKVLRAEMEEFAKANKNVKFGEIERANGEKKPVLLPQQGVDIETAKKARDLQKAYNAELLKSKALQDELNNRTKNWAKTLGENVWKSIKNIASSLLYSGIAAGISYLITLTINWFRKLNDVKRTIKEIKGELDNDLMTASPDMVLAESLKFKDGEVLTDKEREARIKEINKLLGRTGDLAFDEKTTQEEINAALDERINNLKKVNELEAKQKALAALQTKWNDKTNEGDTAESIQKEIDALRQQQNAIPTPSKIATQADWGTYNAQISKIERQISSKQQLLDLDKEIKKLQKEISEIISSDEYQTTGAGEQDGDKDGSSAKAKKLKEDYEKIQKEHNEKLRSLNDRVADEVITKKEYDKALKDLYESTLESIYALDDINENEDAFAKAILDRVRIFKANEEKENKVKKALDDYFKEASGLKRQYVDGIITMEQLDDELFNLREETVKAISSMGKLSESAAILADIYKKQKADKVKREIGELEAPEMGEFDITLNYKKNNSEIYQENADFIKDYADQLDDYIDKLKEYQDDLSGADLEQLNDYITQLETNLETLTGKADSFAQAAKFAEVQEDVKNLKQELNEGIWDNITGIASAAERLTNSFKSLQETWDDPDASGWEKFITTFTTIISVIETIVSVVKTFNAAMKVAEALSLATAAAEQTQIPVKVQDAIATKAQAAAAKELAVARHLAASASVPYPANLAAIASTSAALAAAFAAIPQFAKGGIVAGSSTQGDRNLVRANAGEMILTKGQQGTLWSMLNGKASTGSGNVNFEIRGDKLVGVLNNYSKKISK